jgi:putative transcription antitermination factor YqgF
MTNNFEKILAIDYGTVRLGTALSYGTLAEPLTILANDNQLIDNLKKIIASECVTKIVFGLSENEMAEKTKVFSAQLAAATNLPVIFFDETLSSHEVTEKLKHLGKKNHHRQHIDHFAAAHILQNYLDSLHTL